MSVIWQPSLDGEARKWNDLAGQLTVESFEPLAAELDRDDPLAGWREQFVEPDGIYLDGNSLGPLPAATADRVAAAGLPSVTQTRRVRPSRRSAGLSRQATNEPASRMTSMSRKILRIRVQLLHNFCTFCRRLVSYRRRRAFSNFQMPWPRGAVDAVWGWTIIGLMASKPFLRPSDNETGDGCFLSFFNILRSF